jgi:hypothetical protein
MNWGSQLLKKMAGSVRSSSLSYLTYLSYLSYLTYLTYLR